VNARFVLGVLFLAARLCGCAAQPKPDPAASRILSPEETQEMLAEAGSNWLYGHGFGSTVITVGTIALFPPYALYIIGNSVLAVSGEDPVRFSDVLPADEQSRWEEFYDNVASGPGRLAAAIAGREFRTREHARNSLAPYLEAPKEN
jgi:hypothetical protein